MRRRRLKTKSYPIGAIRSSKALFAALDKGPVFQVYRVFRGALGGDGRERREMRIKKFTLEDLPTDRNTKHWFSYWVNIPLNDDPGDLDFVFENFWFALAHSAAVQNDKSEDNKSISGTQT